MWNQMAQTTLIGSQTFLEESILDLQGILVAVLKKALYSPQISPVFVTMQKGWQIFDLCIPDCNITLYFTGLGTLYLQTDVAILSWRNF